MPWQEFRHPDVETLIAACAERIGIDIDQALATRHQALLALAGGRTSPPVFRRLAAGARDWSRVSIVPSDERWVDHEHVDCNLRQMQEAFAPARGIHWLPLTPKHPDGPADAAFGEQVLSDHQELFDVAMLGMGADGHFASLFPGAPTLAAALDLHHVAACAAIVPDPMPAAGPHARISLTLPRLLRSRRLLLVISGQDKLAVLQRARGGDWSLPVAALLAAHHPEAEIHWSL